MREVEREREDDAMSFISWCEGNIISMDTPDAKKADRIK